MSEVKTIGWVENLLKNKNLLKLSLTKRSGYSRDTKITGITYDSKKAKPGNLFICKGANFRMSYLEEAVSRGCVVFLYPSELYEAVRQTSETSKAALRFQHCRTLPVNDIRQAMAVVAAAWYEYQPNQPPLTAITGTKGKTTTTWFLKAMFDEWEKERRGQESGIISSLQNYDGSSREEATLTTPESLPLHRHIARARKNKLSHMAIEVSSQALKYQRVAGLRFKVGVFLNISEDHISPTEHPDFEDYFQSKLAIFEQTDIACIHLNSPKIREIREAARSARQIITFGTSKQADLCYRPLPSDNKHIRLRVRCDSFCEEFELAMSGSFNIENAAAAITAGWIHGIPVSCMKRALANTQVPGRMETLLSPDRQILGIVDFAHNRLSFQRVFDSIYQDYPDFRKIVCVFGCPGGKAYNRRRDLGLLAGMYADTVYVTSDDPSVEPPAQIANEVCHYVEQMNHNCIYIEDRADAISNAVRDCSDEKTLLLILGKGNEHHQQIGSNTMDYPGDMELLQKAFMNRSAKYA